MNADHLRRTIEWRLHGARAYLRAYRSLAGWERGQRTPITIGDHLPVIFCTWRRLERLPRTLAMLAAQDVPVQALIWNNSPDRERVDKAAADAAIPVAVHHNSRNIGGFGRFYLAREASSAGHHRVVFIDDDQDFGPETVSCLLGTHRPGTLNGWFAFRFPAAGSLRGREPAAPGATAMYIGTGGMVADTAVFTDSRVFGCPRRFWFAEDLWLCYFASHVAGFGLVASPARFEMADDGRNQCATLGWVKSRLVRYLAAQGWDRSPPIAR